MVNRLWLTEILSFLSFFKISVGKTCACDPERAVRHLLSLVASVFKIVDLHELEGLPAVCRFSLSLPSFLLLIKEKGRGNRL